MAPSREEQSWELRLLSTHDPAQANGKDSVEDKAILLPGLSFCSILVLVQEHMALAGSQLSTAGACWWLGSPPSHQGIWTFVYVLLMRLGSQPANGPPWKSPPLMSSPILVPRETCSLFFSISTLLTHGSNTKSSGGLGAEGREGMMARIGDRVALGLYEALTLQGCKSAKERGGHRPISFGIDWLRLLSGTLHLRTSLL